MNVRLSNRKFVFLAQMSNDDTLSFLLTNGKLPVIQEGVNKA